MQKKYAAKSVSELESLLDRLIDSLDDTKELREMTLSQTGQHISGSYVKRFDAEIAEISEDIAEVRASLDRKRNRS